MWLGADGTAASGGEELPRRLLTADSIAQHSLGFCEGISKTDGGRAHDLFIKDDLWLPAF